jgi:hypothetical protein
MLQNGNDKADSTYRPQGSSRKFIRVLQNWTIRSKSAVTLDKVSVHTHKKAQDTQCTDEMPESGAVTSVFFDAE